MSWTAQEDRIIDHGQQNSSRNSSKAPHYSSSAPVTQRSERKSTNAEDGHGTRPSNRNPLDEVGQELEALFKNARNQLHTTTPTQTASKKNIPRPPPIHTTSNLLPSQYSPKISSITPRESYHDLLAESPLASSLSITDSNSNDRPRRRTPRSPQTTKPSVRSINASARKRRTKQRRPSKGGQRPASKKKSAWLGKPGPADAKHSSLLDASTKLERVRKLREIQERKAVAEAARRVRASQTFAWQTGAYILHPCAFLI